MRILFPIAAVLFSLGDSCAPNYPGEDLCPYAADAGCRWNVNTLGDLRAPDGVVVIHSGDCVLLCPTTELGGWRATESRPRRGMQ